VGLIKKLARRFGSRVAHRKLVASSNLFDAEWYVSEYADVRDARVDPLSHFMESGWREKRRPSPKFDTTWYLTKYKDVAKAGVNPLVHFLRYGRAEGRMPTPTKPLLETHRLSDLDRHDVQVRSLKCAAVVHTHYPDLADELLTACLNIPAATQILVSVTNAEAEEAAKAWTARTGFSNLIIKRSPNRGRNVSSFTTTFAREISKSDLFCHIHGKKSLYSGEEKIGWRQNNLAHLLSSSQHVERLLKLFQTREDLGIISPTPSPEVPYWAFTWLSNLEGGAKLSEQLGVPFRFGGYFDYPLGCMFWARPTALRQLLDGRIKYENFPEEAGQTDGTTAHSIERSLFFVAKSNGFGWLEVDAGEGIYKDEWSERNIHQYYATRSFTTLQKEIDASQTVCFDIFDTLITRILPQPDDLFDMAEMSLDTDLNRKTQFRKHRKAAESALRIAKKSGDVSYDEIYQELSKKPETAVMAERAYQMEEDIEARVTLARRQVVRGLQYALSKGKRVILASDMYLNRNQVERLLNQAGIEGYHALYLSSETGLRKDDLSLWRHLIETENAKDLSFLHVGDNEHSDVQIPNALGIRYYHVMSPRKLFDFTPLGYRMRRSGEQHHLPLVLGPTIARLCNDPFEGRP
jgi:FMN phosphatase YigB (HAD superfamily)